MCSVKPEDLLGRKTQSASVESIPEVLEDSSSLAEHSDSASVHDMDYVNPRGVRFTQSSQKEGEDFNWKIKHLVTPIRMF